MKIRSYAKININLHVVKKVSINSVDFMHELNSLTAPINLYDTINLKRCLTNNHYDLKNTCYRILTELGNYRDIPFYEVKIEKRIPIGSGLGGGSSNAASILRYLNYHLKLNLTDLEIKNICISVGSDVLFSYCNKTAYIKGIGDKLEFVEKYREFPYILLVKPNNNLITKDVFKEYDLDPKHLNNNDLYTAAFKLLPEIKNIENELKIFSPQYISMSGSGPTMFALFNKYSDRNKAFNYFKNKYNFVYKASFL